MRIVKCSNYEDAVNKLQQYVDAFWHRNPGGHRRQWLKAIPADSYRDKAYRVELWVLEGSPVKQIVVINHCMKDIHCHDYLLRKEIRFVWNRHV